MFNHQAMFSSSLVKILFSRSSRLPQDRSPPGLRFQALGRNHRDRPLEPPVRIVAPVDHMRDVGLHVYAQLQEIHPHLQLDEAVEQSHHTLRRWQIRFPLGHVLFPPSLAILMTHCHAVITHCPGTIQKHSPPSTCITHPVLQISAISLLKRH